MDNEPAAVDVIRLARLGRTHCALCEITHGSVRARPEWRACQTELPVPFDTYHRDDQPEAVRRAAAGRAPVVVAETADGSVVLLGPGDLDGLDGSVDGLLAAVERRLADEGLRLPAG